MSPLMIMSGYGAGKDTLAGAHSVSWSLQDKILPGAVLTAARNRARTPAARIRRGRRREKQQKKKNNQTVCYLLRFQVLSIDALTDVHLQHSDYSQYCHFVV